MSKCDLPPVGWACTRGLGHPGPCAAVPEDLSGALASALEPPSPTAAQASLAQTADNASEPSQTATPYPESFAGYPESLTEIAAHRADNGQSWTGRDVLICALRELDEGKHSSENVIVIFHGPITESNSELSMFQRSPSRGSLMGVLERVRMRLYQMAAGA
jgi:hypothetical protein